MDEISERGDLGKTPVSKAHGGLLPNGRDFDFIGAKQP
jgi:hypothetical protein